eukprot:TRINITY_DN2153_c0_g1_i3.p1 TRINITY_DN2153_c0_g1~~TRINITY_DN2153_c0_g1_i3.p1  ORF type:complete len:570 (-),score=107.17 TRINITY_DN2153_c0_g1_i3:87-1796(-)
MASLKHSILYPLLLLLVWSFSFAKGKYGFMREAKHSGKRAFYDYIVVGGGTSGCPLAATLSRNFSVLLLERGGSPYGNINVSRAENFHINLMDMSENSPSQLFVSEDGVVNSRARVLGGGSSINAGFYSRASTQYVKSVGWDERVVNESYPWVEKVVAHRPAVKPWQSAVRNALLEVGIAPYNGFTYDHVFGTKEGGTIFDDEGYRHTAADLLSYAEPSRITVLLHATVQKILLSKPKGDGIPVAVGVFYKDAEGGLHEALLKRGVAGSSVLESEVILSAGALGSPQLLMLSGIGPKDHLVSKGIPVVLHQPYVGMEMADNPMNSIVVPTETPIEKSLLQVVGITKFGSFIEASSGFSTMPTSIHTGYAYESWKGKDKSKKKLLSRPYVTEDFKGGFILEKIKGPVSKGFLLLKTDKAEDTPSVTFNYFKSTRDLKRCVKGIKQIERMIKSRSFYNFLNATSTSATQLSIQHLRNISAAMATNVLPKHPNLTTSTEQFCRDTVTTIWHYHGGCVLGKVVDSQYRVMGLKSLRVVDGSTFRASPGTNPQATVMMLGRYVGLKILKHRLFH